MAILGAVYDGQAYVRTPEQVRQRDPAGHKPVVILMDGQHCLWTDAQKALPGGDS